MYGKRAVCRFKCVVINAVSYTHLIIIGHNGEDFLVAESRVPLSTITTLSRFIKRSANQRYAIKRLDAGLTEQQKQRIVEQVPSRLRKLYHTGFKYESSRQFCSKFVFDIYKEALCIPVGEIEDVYKRQVFQT